MHLPVQRSGNIEMFQAELVSTLMSAEEKLKRKQVKYMINNYKFLSML